MSSSAEYLKEAMRILDEIGSREMENIRASGALVADTLQGGGMLYLFGTGHSHLLAEEVFYRAGGLVRIYPILEEGLMLHNGAAKSTDLERVEGLAAPILNHCGIKSGDALILCSNSGRNALPVEMALLCRKKGVRVIAVTSLAHSESAKPRNRWGKRLFEVADVTIDNHGPVGDAVVWVEGLGQRIGPTSTVAGAAILHMVVAEAVDALLARGARPECFVSSNVDGGDEINAKYIGHYRGVVKPL
jgi:uncharacterized phosphosugar-binding protein